MSTHSSMDRATDFGSVCRGSSPLGWAILAYIGIETRYFMKKGIAYAHGKTIIIGEHSAVYGEPAISTVFKGLTVETIIEKTNFEDIFIESIYYTGPLNDGPKELENIKKVLDKFAKEKDLNIKNIDIKIHSDIPAEKGLGSSAAVSVSLTKALYNFFGEKLTKEELYKWSCMSEEIVHGKASGIDSTTIIEDSTLFYKKYEVFENLNINIDGYLVVADSGEKGSTKEAVRDVELLIEENKNGKNIISALGELTYIAKKALLEGNLNALGKIMTQAHIFLKNLTVSNEKLDNMVALALDNGALGAKLTGGGRGGCIIALCENLKSAKKVKTALEKVSRGVWISDFR